MIIPVTAGTSSTVMMGATTSFSCQLARVVHLTPPPPSSYMYDWSSDQGYYDSSLVKGNHILEVNQKLQHRARPFVTAPSRIQIILCVT